MMGAHFILVASINYKSHGKACCLCLSLFVMFCPRKEPPPLRPRQRIQYPVKALEHTTWAASMMG